MTNEEFRQLCLLKKHFLDKNISLPMTGEKCASIPVYSNTTKDIFSLLYLFLTFAIFLQKSALYPFP